MQSLTLELGVKVELVIYVFMCSFHIVQNTVDQQQNCIHQILYTMESDLTLL